MQLKQIFHRLGRQKDLTLISLGGLTLGYICFFLILSYCRYERSFDRFHKNGDNTYRVAYKRFNQEVMEYETANGFYPEGRYLQENVPSIVNHTTLARNYNLTIASESAGGQQVFFNEEKTYFASSSFLSVFSFPLLKGNPRDLDKPNTVFLTERAAQKYFGSADPIGRTLKVNGRDTYAVAGILQNPPSNTHLRFDFLFSLTTHLHKLGDWINNHWYGYDLFYTYIQLKEGADPASVQQMLPVMVEKNYGEQLKGASKRDEFFLQPLADIHLHSSLEWETEKPGNGEAIRILLYFSVFVLLITWINHINLTSAQSPGRAREVGVRKTLGASRGLVMGELAGQFAALPVLSLLAAALLLALASRLPAASAFFAPEVLTDAVFWGIIAAVAVAGILATSLLPALPLSRYLPADVLKGRLAPTFRNLFLRKALLGFQYVVSFILITGALLIHNQGTYLLNKDRGLDNSSVVAIRFPKVLDSTLDTKEQAALFRDKVRPLPWVKDYTAATDVPEQEIENFGSMYRRERGKVDEKAYFRVGADDNYFRFFKVRLVAGRFLSQDIKSDELGVVLNESAVKKLGYDRPEDVINLRVGSGKKERTVVGVVQDFHYRSIKVKPVATMFNYQQKGLSYFAVKLFPGDAQVREHLEVLRGIYGAQFPGNPFEYFFLEEAMKKDLRADLDFANIFGAFSLLSILISLTGLLGLVIISLNQSVKELGIRKVMGAGFGDIALLVAKKFAPPLAIALLVGIPASVWGFSWWISTYYIYHIPVSWHYFAVPTLFLTVLAVLVIAFQVYRVYHQKAIIALKYE
ncbi:ABC transporter permease [Paraflavisolibacter sp. H34]|uniref:ABC transporter permease n=1 Tax=Huijunlia imazamoxiresistens TaxID=3127457 RepID=UPI00301852D4